MPRNEDPTLLYAFHSASSPPLFVAILHSFDLLSAIRSGKMVWVRQYSNLLQHMLNIYWTVATLAIISKTVSPRLERLLNYGKLGNSANLPQTPHALLMRRPGVAWALFYVTGGIIAVVCKSVALKGSTRDCKRASLLFGLFAAHIARRLWECIFVHRRSPNAIISSLQLLSGLSFYVATPITLLLCPAFKTPIRYDQCSLGLRQFSVSCNLYSFLQARVDLLDKFSPRSLHT